MTPEALPLDDEFLAAFLACRLEPRHFSHRAHVRMAWLLLDRYPLPEAIDAICESIRRYAAHVGAPDKYNRTLSEALVRLIAARGHSTDWPHFIAAHPDLLGDVRTLLAHHYSPERLFSVTARQRFLEPDRAPLPPCQPLSRDL